MIIKGIVNPITDLIEKAEKAVISGMKEERFEFERDITSRFAQELEHIVKGKFETKGISFKTRVLKDVGENNEERKYGADLVGVLDVQLKGYQMSKGFLMQAKLESPWAKLNNNILEAEGVTFKPNSEFLRLQQQAKNMLEVTPDAYVFVYGINSFSAVPATSITGLNATGRLYGKTMKAFFKDFLTCFIGDPSLNAVNENTLEILKKKHNSETALLIQIHDKTN